MKFYTAAGEPRPVRFNDDIRLWAWESQHGKYGDEAVENWAVKMDDIPGYADMPSIRQQDIAIRRIAEQAPVRICPMNGLPALRRWTWAYVISYRPS